MVKPMVYSFYNSQQLFLKRAYGKKILWACSYLYLIGIALPSSYSWEKIVDVHYCPFWGREPKPSPLMILP